MSTKVKVFFVVCFHVICLSYGYIMPLVIQFSTALPLYIFYKFKNREYDADFGRMIDKEDAERKKKESSAALRQYLYKPSQSYFVTSGERFGFPKSFDETWWVYARNDIYNHLIYRLFIAKQLFIGEYSDILSLVKQMIFSSVRCRRINAV